MGKRISVASGALLAALAVAGAAVGHADPNDQQAQPPANTADLAAATAPAPVNTPGPAAESLTPPAGPAAAGPNQSQSSPASSNPDESNGEHEQEHPAAAPPAAGGMGNIGASIGTSMATSLPMMAMYLPMMGLPALSSGLPLLAQVAEKNPDLLDSLTSGGASLDPASAAAALPDLGAAGEAASALDPAPVADLGSVLDPAPVLDAATDAAHAAAGGGLEIGGAAACTALGIIFGAC